MLSRWPPSGPTPSARARRRASRRPRPASRRVSGQAVMGVGQEQGPAAADASSSSGTQLGPLHCRFPCLCSAAHLARLLAGAGLDNCSRRQPQAVSAHTCCCCCCGLASIALPNSTAATTDVQVRRRRGAVGRAMARASSRLCGRGWCSGPRTSCSQWTRRRSREWE